MSAEPQGVESLYTLTAVEPTGGPDPDPDPPTPPGTVLTASVETIDNDRAELMLDAGVVR